MAETDKAFIGVKSCGCASATVVVGYATKREEQAELKRWMKSGRKVELTTVAEARKGKNFLNCPHEEGPHEEGFVSPDNVADEAERLVMEARA